jgi:hypothetical protein
MSGAFYTNNPAKIRPTAEAAESEHQALKRMLFESELPLKAIAAQIGVPAGRLYDAADESRDAHLQARLIPALTRVTGRDDLINFYSHACGGVFVRIDASSPFTERAAQILKETADVLHTAAAAEADGRVTEREACDVRRQVEEAQAALESYARWMESRAEAER